MTRIDGVAGFRAVVSMTAGAVVLALACTLLVAQPAHAAPMTFTDALGITYEADNVDPGAGATATAYDPVVGGPIVDIPDTVTHDGDDYPVTTIGDWAFAHNSLTEVTIPDSVTTIDGYAFAYNSLAEVTIPDSVTTIGAYAFARNSLAEVTIPDSVTTIGGWAFVHNSLAEVTIPDSVTTIGNRAFAYNSLAEVTIGDSVTTIGDSAFRGNALTGVTIPDSVTAIGAEAFSDNDSLSVVRFEGDAPTVFTAAGLSGSFGEAAGKTLYVYSSATGFTSPTWEGYTIAVVSTVGFDPNGGSGVMPVQAESETTTLTSNDFTRDGHSFTGWNTSADGTGVGYADGAEYDFAADVTLYAQWTLNTYTVTFDAGEGDAVAPVVVIHGAALVAPAEPTRVGYTFTGWFTDADATVLFDFDAPVTSGLTLYAGWEPVTAPVDPDPADPDPADPDPVDPDPVDPDSVVEDNIAADELAATGVDINVAMLLAALLAIVGGISLVLYRRMVHSRT